jgi:hypothetical protein
VGRHHAGTANRFTLAGIHFKKKPERYWGRTVMLRYIVAFRLEYRARVLAAAAHFRRGLLAFRETHLTDFPKFTGLAIAKPSSNGRSEQSVCGRVHAARMR